MLTENYFKNIKKIPLLAPEEELRLIKQAQEGDINAEQRIIQSTLRLVPAAIHKYKNKGVVYDDLVQEGNLALHKAIHNFKFEKGNRFSSFAYKTIEKNALGIIKNNSLIKKSDYRLKQLWEYKKALMKLEQELECTPSIQEVAEELKTTEQRILQLQRWDTRIEMGKTLEKLCETLPSPSQYDPVQHEKETYIQKIIAGKLSQLTDFEQKLLIARFRLEEGVKTKCERSYRATAALLGVSHVYVYKMERLLIKKLNQIFELQDY